MSALDELLKDIPQDYEEVDVANHLLHWREPSAAELLDLRAELATAKARAKTAEENWHKNEARIAKLESELQFIHGFTLGDGDHDKVMLAKGADIFMQCFKALGLDVSGTDPEEIVDEIKRLKGVA